MFQRDNTGSQAARDWFDTAAARPWRQCEIGVLEQLLPLLSGYRCLQLGPAAIATRTNAAPGTLRFWCADSRRVSGSDICIDGQHLPLASGSVDALVLIHALELSDDPQLLLRECGRALSDRGQLLALVFNPVSPWWLMQPLRLVGGRFRAHSTPPGPGQLSGWLKARQLEATNVWRYGPGNSLSEQPSLQRAWPRPGLPWLAPAYALLARRCAMPGQSGRRDRIFKRSPPAGRLAFNQESNS